MDPNIQAILLAVIANGLTAFIAQFGRKDSKLLLGEELLKKIKWEETALQPILQRAAQAVAETIEWQGLPTVEVVCLFLSSPEAEAVVRQLYLVKPSEGRGDLASLRKAFLTAFYSFTTVYTSYTELREDQLADSSKILLDTLIEGCEQALNIAIDNGILAAHEAKSAYRHHLLLEELREEQEKQSETIVTELAKFIGPRLPPPLDEATARARYLECLYKQCNSVKLPIEPREDLSLQIILQPLRLRRDPLTAEDLAREERRTLMDDPAYSDDDLRRTLPDSNYRGPRTRSRHASPAVIASDGEDALGKSPKGRMAILGGPGTGKTTLLKYLVRDRTKKAKDDPTAPLPIFISLPELARSGKTLKEYLHHSLEDMRVDGRYADVLWEALDKGKAFICLDSLDEVLSQRLEMIRKINIQVASAGNTWIVSSRFTHYKGGQLDSDQFTKWELQPMDHSLRRKLAQRLLPELHRLIHKSKKRTKYTPMAFVKALEKYPRVATWGKNPLLFSLAAVVFVYTGKLPSSRAELYQKVVDAILETREQVDVRRKMLRRVIAALALELYYQRKGRTFTLSDLLPLLPKIRGEWGEIWDTEEMTQRILNSGTLDVVAKETYGFLHQTFQEYLAAEHLLLLHGEEAKREINRLIKYVDEPFCCQIIVEFAHLAYYQQERTLEDYLYGELIAHLGSSKMVVLEAQREGRPDLTSASSMSSGIDYILQDLVDHWGSRMCATLESGFPDRTEDGEVASTIGSLFERNPRPFAVPALISSMRKYRKKGRFIGALGKIGTGEAKSAPLTFIREQIAHPSDQVVFRYLAAALGEAHVADAIPLLQAIQSGSGYDETAKYEARKALWLLGQEKTFEERRYYRREDIIKALSVADEEGRPSDWKGVADTANWLEYYGPKDQLVQTYLVEIISALEKALSHQYDVAREPVVGALGELGSSQTFVFLAQRLERHGEPSYKSARKMLASLVRLAERNQISPTMSGWIVETFSRIRLAYPLLEEVVNKAELSILEYLERMRHDRGKN